MDKYKNKNGFTLVEMILTTVIIGILAGVVINVINIPRIQARSRDSKRIGDLKRIQTALELYFSDLREYPAQAGSWIRTDTAGFKTTLTNYISDVPSDSRSNDASALNCFSASNHNYGYYYRSQSAGSYILGATVELDASSEGNSCGIADVSNCADPNYGCNSNLRCYCVQNPM